MYKVTNIEDMTGTEIYSALDSIKGRYLLGQIEYITAVEAVEELLKVVNKRGLLIAKKYGKRFHKVTAIQVLR